LNSIVLNVVIPEIWVTPTAIGLGLESVIFPPVVEKNLLVPPTSSTETINCLVPL
jgi:hypothetical protein